MVSMKDLLPPSPWRPLSESEAKKVEAVSATFLSRLDYMKSEKLTAVAKATAPFRLTAPEARIDLDAYLESLKQRHTKLVRSPKVAALVAEAKTA